MAMAVVTPKLMNVMYLTGQHNVIPSPELVASVTHVELAFLNSPIFNEPNPTSWPLFTTVEEVRAKFAPGTKVMVAIGGWGDSGFSEAAKSDASRKLFARNVKAMVDDTGADGVDVDWEYPGGNGEDYKTPPNTNPSKTWEIHAYPLLLAEIRAALGPSKLISAAVPGLERDMIAFTHDTVPLINDSIDFFNIMTYDLMNRRDNITEHHTGLQGSIDSIDAYLSRGVPASKMNLGFAFYVKWFRTDPDASADCSKNPIGCKTALMEDPTTGADLGQAGAFSWHDSVPTSLSSSFEKAQTEGVYDEDGGGYYYFDAAEDLFWSFDRPEDVKTKVPAIVEKLGLGGVFAWGLGEDAEGFEHLRALNEGLERMTRTDEERRGRWRDDMPVIMGDGGDEHEEL